MIDDAYVIARKYCTKPRHDGSPAMQHIYNIQDILCDMGITFSYWNGTGYYYHLAAVLHDVIEDCHDVDPNDDSALKAIRELDVPDDGSMGGTRGWVLDVVKTLTHPPEEPYEAYIDRITGALKLAPTQIKIADIIDNVTSNPTAKARKNYRKALPRLYRRTAGFI